MLNKQEVLEFRDKLDSMDLETLNKEFDGLLESQSSMMFKVDDSLQQSILDYLNSNIYSAPFALSGPTLSLFDAVTAKDDLGVGHVRTLQQLIIEHSKFSSLSDARTLANILKALEPVNIELGKLEMKARHIGEFITRKENEEKSGLKHKEGDHQLAAEAEGVTGIEDGVSVKEAKMEIVSDAKGKAKGKAKAKKS